VSGRYAFELTAVAGFAAALAALWAMGAFR